MPQLFEWPIIRNPTTGVTLLFGFAPLLAFYVAATPFQLLACLLTYSALALAAYFFTMVVGIRRRIRLSRRIDVHLWRLTSQRPNASALIRTTTMPLLHATYIECAELA